jgi:hypothetical protein
LAQRAPAQDPGRQHAGQLGAHRRVGANAAVLVELEEVGEQLGVRLQADVDEDAAELEVRRVARCRVANAYAGNGVLAEDLLDRGVVADRDLRVLERSVAIGRLGGERVTAVDDDDLGHRFGQGERLLQRRVAPADHADDAVAHERRIAAGALADAATLQARLALDAEGLQAGACRQDDGARVRLTVVALQPPAVVGTLDVAQLGHAHVDAHVGRLLLEGRKELVARYAFREAGDAVDLLDAEQQPAGRAPAKDERGAPGSGSVKRCGQTADPPAGDDNVVLVGHLVATITATHSEQSCACRTPDVAVRAGAPGGRAAGARSCRPRA